MSDGYIAVEITITKTVTEDDVIVTVDGIEDLPVVDALGLLRLAEDTILHPPEDPE